LKECISDIAGEICHTSPNHQIDCHSSSLLDSSSLCFDASSAASDLSDPKKLSGGSSSSIPSSLNLSPTTILVMAGSGFTPSGLGVEWSAYQSETCEVTSLKNWRKAPFFNGKLSCGVLKKKENWKKNQGTTCLSTSKASLLPDLSLAQASNPADVQHHQAFQ